MGKPYPVDLRLAVVRLRGWIAEHPDLTLGELRGRPSKEKMEVSTRRKDRRDAEGEGRLGGPAGRGERGQPGSTPSSSLKPDLCVEEAASGAGGAGVRGWSMGAVGQPPEQRPRLD